MPFHTFVGNWDSLFCEVLNLIYHPSFIRTLVFSLLILWNSFSYSSGSLSIISLFMASVIYGQAWTKILNGKFHR